MPRELAHVWIACRCGVVVRELGLGLPPRAWSFRWRGITWSVNWLLPLGAWVKLKGEDGAGGCGQDDYLGRPAREQIAIPLTGPLAVAGLAIGVSRLLVGQPAGMG